MWEIFGINSNMADAKLAGTVRYSSSCCQAAAPRSMAAEIVDMGGSGSVECSEFGDQLKKNPISMPFGDGPVTELISKRPRYDDAKKAFVMKFNSRVKRSSVKNFILVKKDL
jgi:hypothetical protein